MRLAAASLFVLALVWIGFQPALDAGLLRFDDDQALTLNPHFRGLGTRQLAWMASTPRLGHYQPLTWLSYALDWSAAGALEPATLHRTNLLLHGLAAVVFLFMARALLRRARPAADPAALALAAAAAAALFAVHPLRAESVAWITERRDVLSAPTFFLCLLAWVRWADERRPAARGSLAAACCAALAAGLFLAFVELDTARGTLSARPAAWLAVPALAASALPLLRSGPRAGWYLLALLAMLASLGAKAWGIVLPALLLVLDAYPLRRWRGRRDALPLLAEKLPFAALALVFAALARWAQASQAGTMKTLAEHTLLERALQAGYGLAWYPFKTLVPSGLSPIHELPHTLLASDPRFLVPAAAVLALTALLLARRRRWPALAAAWAAYALIVAPVLGLAQSGPQLVADRYSYLSCAPFALLVGGGWLALAERARWCWPAGGVALALVLGAATWSTRAQVARWESDATLWEHALAVDPKSYSAHLQLGKVRLEQGRAEEARALLERGFELEHDPRFLEALGRYWELRAGAEPGQEAEHRARALEFQRRAYVLALETERFLPSYRLNYGVALWNTGRSEQALEHLAWYAEQQPEAFAGRLYLGSALGALGRHEQALAHLEAAVELEARSVEAWRALARAREALGWPERARSAWERVLALAPGDAAASTALERLGAGH